LDQGGTFRIQLLSTIARRQLNNACLSQKEQQVDHELEVYRRAVAEYGVPKEMLSDQGRQYSSWRGTTRFEAELRKDRVHHIKRRPHHPMTLGKIERFWKTLLRPRCRGRPLFVECVFREWAMAAAALANFFLGLPAIQGVAFWGDLSGLWRCHACGCPD
jgi:transposase InsO family protein